MQLIDKCKALLEYVENNPLAEQDAEYAEDHYIGGGICDSVADRKDNQLLRKIFSTWVHYSGDPWYPINKDSSLYEQHSLQPFNTEHEYCRLRVDLLKHIITCLENEDGSVDQN